MKRYKKHTQKKKQNNLVNILRFDLKFKKSGINTSANKVGKKHESSFEIGPKICHENVVWFSGVSKYKSEHQHNLSTISKAFRDVN